MIVTKMESGPLRRTLMTNDDTTSGSAAFIWDLAQKTAWETLFSSTIKKGTIPIDDFPLDLGGGTTGHRAYLSDPKQQTLVPNVTWKITIGFETDERNAA
jgi:hypothetical protein